MLGCWESNVTDTTTLCYGAGNKCNENEALCHELDNCDEIYAEEQLSVDDS